MPYLPIPFPGDINLGISRVSRCNGFKSIVGSTEGVLRNVCRCNCLTCSTRGKTSCTIIFFRFPGGSVSRKGSPAYNSHLKHTCADPNPGYFDGFTGSVVFRICLFKKWKYSF